MIDSTATDLRRIVLGEDFVSSRKCIQYMGCFTMKFGVDGIRYRSCFPPSACCKIPKDTKMNISTWWSTLQQGLPAINRRKRTYKPPWGRPQTNPPRVWDLHKSVFSNNFVSSTSRAIFTCHLCSSHHRDRASIEAAPVSCEIWVRVGVPS